jgi:hypothetical protein
MNQWLRNIVAVLVAIMPVCAFAQGATPATSGASAENANNPIPAGSVAGPERLVHLVSPRYVTLQLQK